METLFSLRLEIRRFSYPVIRDTPFYHCAAILRKQKLRDGSLDFRKYVAAPVRAADQSRTERHRAAVPLPPGGEPDFLSRPAASLVFSCSKRSPGCTVRRWKIPSFISAETIPRTGSPETINSFISLLRPSPACFSARSEKNFYTGA